VGGGAWYALDGNLGRPQFVWTC